MRTDLHVWYVCIWLSPCSLARMSAESKLEHKRSSSWMSLVTWSCFGFVWDTFHCHLPISGFLAWSASSVRKRVLGKRMNILDLRGMKEYNSHDCKVCHRSKERMVWKWMEDALPAKFVLLLLVAEVVDQRGHTIVESPIPVRPRLRTQRFVPEGVST